MENTSAVQAQQQEEPVDPVVRIAYAAGAAMLVFGGLMPHQHGWSAAGIALIAFCWMFE